MRLTFSTMVAATLLALGATAHGQNSMMREATSATPVRGQFADLSGFDVLEIVPPAPAADSMTNESDLRTVLQVQAARTPKQAEWAQLVAEGNMFALFGADNLFGARFSRDSRPRLAALMTQLITEARPLNVATKDKFHRPRPFVADPRVHPCVERPTSDSYPSGHAFTAFLWAAVLAEIHPEQRVAVWERADRIIWGRVIGGVHYPTDLAAGRRLAAAVFAAEMKNPAFRAALEECRAEAAARPLKKAA